MPKASKPVELSSLDFFVHEIRRPLSIIRLLLSKFEKHTDVEVRTIGRKIDQEISKIAELLDQML